MVDDRLRFKINPFEEEYLEKQGIGFSEYVHRKFYEDMKKSHYIKIDLYMSKIGYILMGCILLSITYIITNIVAYLVLVLSGVVLIGIGFFSMMLEVKNGRKLRKRFYD